MPLRQVAMFMNLNGDPAIIGKALSGRAHRNAVRRAPAEPLRRSDGRKTGFAIEGGSVLQRNRDARRPEHPGRQQPARRGNAANELPVE